MRLSRQVLAVLMATLLLAMVGCASKTTPEPAPVVPPPPVQAPPTTDVTQQPVVRGVESQPVQSGPVADHQAVAGLERIYFSYDQFTLEDAARVTLEQNAVYLRSHPKEKIVIEGHCDERGSDEYNLALGERRAVTAKNYLVSLGIAADRLSVVSYGEEQPLVAGSGEEAWSKNRRAEFKVVR
ncbi:MAG: peptidoglycan-associated lipoprotein Pal [Desulfuromonas sp.]|nr:peptidoglycan-associated lipoprotein Pal [Desulfuromonas sp.]